MFSIIAAVGKNNELGNKGGLCFSIREDMKFFRETTKGHKVFMGENTWKSLPGKLPNREHYVLTREPENIPKDVNTVTDLEKYIKENKDTDEKIFVIGGGMVYKQMLPHAKEMFLTEIDANAEADVFFPDFDKTEWKKEEIGKGEENGIKYSFTKYTRK